MLALYTPRRHLMSTTQAGSGTDGPATATGDLKLEVVVIAVTDVDRAKALLRGPRLAARRRLPRRRRLPHRPVHAARLGVLDPVRRPGHDRGTRVGDERVPGRRGHPGRARRARGPRCRGRRRCSTRSALGDRFHPEARAPGAAPERGTYGSFASFSDPDGNTWLLQEITTRLPGRIDVGVTGFVSVAELADALRRAAAAHGEHEARTGEADANWPDWYAAYIAAEQAGAELPQ